MSRPKLGLQYAGRYPANEPNYLDFDANTPLEPEIIESLQTLRELYSTSGIKPLQPSPEAPHHSHEHLGSEYISWLHPQEIWGLLTETQRDMFDSCISN